jgi:hypothetical protein
MSERFTLPASAAEADALANELGVLATATEWKRSAVVYSRVRVEDGPGRPPAEKANSGLLSPAEYALRGIHGLRSKTTVRAYWRAWDNAIAEGLAQAVALGDTVELPDAEWNDCYHPADQTTPPYYVPHDAAAPLPTDDADEADAQFSWEERSQRDGLGLGSCPPVASDIDQPDGRPPPPPPDPKRRSYNLTVRLTLSKLGSIEEDAATVLRYASELNSTDGRRVLKRIARIHKLLTDIERAIQAEAGDA